MAKQAPEFVADGSTTDSAKNVQQHGFSGKTCEIKLFKADKDSHEPKEPFIGLNFWQATIQRDKWVRVPVEVADHIESCKYTVKEPDPADPENIDKFVWVERERFPLQRRD